MQYLITRYTTDDITVDDTEINQYNKNMIKKRYNANYTTSFIRIRNKIKLS